MWCEEFKIRNSLAQISQNLTFPHFPLFEIFAQVYFCEMYSTCMSSKLCKFIFVWISSLIQTQSIVANLNSAQHQISNTCMYHPKSQRRIDIKMCKLQNMAHCAHREIVHHGKNDKSPSGFLSHNISSHQIKSHSVTSAYRCYLHNCTNNLIISTNSFTLMSLPGKLHFFIKSINDMCVTIATHIIAIQRLIFFSFSDESSGAELKQQEPTVILRDRYFQLYDAFECEDDKSDSPIHSMTFKSVGESDQEMTSFIAEKYIL